MKLAFPNTSEGMKLRKTFDLHVKEGEPITLKGDVIQELRFSNWWEEWFGGFDLKEAEIHIGESKSDHPVSITFKIIPNTGRTISLTRMEFRLIRSGTEYIKFSNEHTNCPLLLNFNLRKEEKLLQGTLNYLFRHVGGDPHELLDYLDFTKAIATGGKLRIEFHDVNQSYSTDFPPVSNTGPDPTFHELVQKLCVVQDKTGKFFKVPNEGISQQEADTIIELYEIVENGVIRYTNSTTFLELKDKALQAFFDACKQGNSIPLRFTAEDSYVELFGETIKTGPRNREVTCFVEMDASEFKDKINNLKPGEFLKVNLVNVNGVETVPEWQTKNM